MNEHADQYMNEQIDGQARGHMNKKCILHIVYWCTRLAVMEFSENVICQLSHTQTVLKCN